MHIDTYIHTNAKQQLEEGRMEQVPKNILIHLIGISALLEIVKRQSSLFCPELLLYYINIAKT